MPERLLTTCVFPSVCSWFGTRSKCLLPALLLVPVALQGLVDSDGAVMLVEPRHLDQLLHPMFENEKAYQRDVITKGLGASPGAAVGKLVFTAGGQGRKGRAQLPRLCYDVPAEHCMESQLCCFVC